MNRKIKFRIWDHHVERMNNWDWVEGSFIKIGEVFDNELYTVMLYTGLKDKYDMPIYEGDIVEIGSDNPSKAEVFYYDGAFWVETKSRKLLGNIPQEWLDVIGNRFQDPDLLESYKSYAQSD